jgi:hypothetical protein
MDALVATSRRLNASVEALAALGAVLRLRRDGLTADPTVARLLDEIVGALGPDLLTGLEPSQEATALAFIETFFRQAGDLLAQPERAPGWTYDEPAQLQSQGQASRIVVRPSPELLPSCQRWPNSWPGQAAFSMSVRVSAGWPSRPRRPGQRCGWRASMSGSRR